MGYYDLVLKSCRTSGEFAARLGFERLFFVDDKGGALCIGSDKQMLLAGLQRGADAVAVTDFTIDRKLLARVKEREAMLCMPFCAILEKDAAERARLLYRASALAHYAMSNRIEVALVSLASSSLYMGSYMQLIELAKLIGIKEEYARNSISASNRRLGELCDKG